MCGLFFQTDGAARRIKLDDAIGGGILDRVGKDDGPVFQCCTVLQELGDVLSVEDVVAQDESAGGRR